MQKENVDDDDGGMFLNPALRKRQQDPKWHGGVQGVHKHNGESWLGTFFIDNDTG